MINPLKRPYLGKSRKEIRD